MPEAYQEFEEAEGDDGFGVVGFGPDEERPEADGEDEGKEDFHGNPGVAVGSSNLKLYDER